MIHALLSQNLTEFIVTKTIPDKDAMKIKLTDTDLASVGCRIDQTESFWIEPKLEESKKI